MNTPDRAGDLARWQGGVDATLAQLRDGLTKIGSTLDESRAESREGRHQIRDAMQQMALTHAQTRHEVAALAAEHKVFRQSVEAKHAEHDDEIESLKGQMAPWTWGRRLGAALVGGVVVAVSLGQQFANFFKALRP